MTDKTKVEEAIADLAGAVLDNDDRRAMGAFGVLVGGALVDLNRIANAVEKLVTMDELKRGDPVLSAEERETIEALRRGEITVVDKIPAPEPDPVPIARCPLCTARIQSTERRPDGFSYCNNGHKFKTADAITR